MDDPKSIMLAARLVLAAYSAVVVVIGVWTAFARVPRTVRSRYDEKTVRLSQLPFTERWRATVAAEDLPFFVKARLRRHILVIALIGLVAYMPLVYVYLQGVAELLQCHLTAAGL